MLTIYQQLGSTEKPLTGPCPSSTVFTTIYAHPAQSTSLVAVAVARYAVEVGPSWKAGNWCRVVVQAVGAERLWELLVGGVGRKRGGRGEGEEGDGTLGGEMTDVGERRRMVVRAAERVGKGNFILEFGWFGWVGDGKLGSY